MLNRRRELTGIALLTIAVLCLSIPSIAADDEKEIGASKRIGQCNEGASFVIQRRSHQCAE